MSTTKLPTRVIGLIIACAVLITFALLPDSGSFTHQGWLSIGLLLTLAVMWITTPIPLGATGLLILVLMLLLGIAPNWAGATGGFANNAVFFAVAIFCLPVVVMKTKWGIRLVGWLVERVHENSRKLILLFMITCALLSTVLSDFCVTIIFYGFALTILKAANADPAHSNLGKCLMIGIPVAAVIGGMATPVGGNFNILAISTMEQATGTGVSFLEWMAIGLPIAAVMVPIAWFFLTLAFKPEPIEDRFLTEIREEAAAAKDIDGFDVKAGAVIILTLIAWVVSSFVPVLDPTMVTIIALALMMLPGLDLINFKEVQQQVPWDIVIIIGTIISLGMVVMQTGAAKAMAEVLMATGLTGWDVIPMCLFIFAFIYLLHTFFPIGAAIIAIFVPITIPLFAAIGVSAVVPTVAIAICVAGNFLLPFNPTVALTFGQGYYKAGEMVKFGIGPAICLVVLMSLWIPLISGLFA